MPKINYFKIINCYYNNLFANNFILKKLGNWLLESIFGILSIKILKLMLRAETFA